MISVPTTKYVNSSFAIIVLGNKFILQKRDKKKSIWYPSMLGLFGGKIEVNETPYEAIQREIFEETNLKIKKFQFICSISISKKNKLYNRNVYSTSIKCLPNNFKVNEGRGYLEVEDKNIHKLKKKIVPNDYIAISNYLRIKRKFYLC